MRGWIFANAFLLASFVFTLRAGQPELGVERTDSFVAFKSEGDELLRYWLKKPSGISLPVESAAFFHPLKTPKGVVITDLAPADHPHHRGVFLAWVEMHGAADADFWGWGEPAPVQDRSISNRKLTGIRTKGHVGAFAAENAWTATNQTMVVERLQVVFSAGQQANVLDLNYRLTPSEPTELARWAFSGFCVRTLNQGTVVAHSPEGVVKLPDPIHTAPDSDWPDAPWYAFSLTLPDGSEAGVAVLNHPDNPPTLWHNHRKTRMLNPCIVAPGAVRLEKHEPLRLRYRVVAYDGAVPVQFLNDLAGRWDELP